MVKIALVEDSEESKAIYLAGCVMPAFYMNDYTILGFPVKNFAMVRELLKKEGYALIDTNGGSNIVFENLKQLPALQELFWQNGIDTSLTDIADTFYQA